MLPFTRRGRPAPAEGRKLSFDPTNYYLQYSEWYFIKATTSGPSVLDTLLDFPL